MKNGLVLPLVAVIISSSAPLIGNAYAFGFGHHREMSAAGPCIAVMNSSQRANFKQTFGTERQALQNDRQNVATAKQTLMSAILSNTKDLTTQESGLAAAQQQLQKDEDSAAQQVCSQLSSTQMTAALTLFNNLTTLHTNMRQQARTYFQQAQAAAGSQGQPGSE